MSTSPFTPFEPYLQIAGDGEPIVMVHGGWTDHTSWQFVAPDLATDHLVVTYDRRGHSRSASCEAGSRRLDEDDLVQLIHHLDRGPVHLVGNSYGAAIVLTVAARCPQLVRSVIAHEPPLIGIGRPGTPLGETRGRVHDVLQLVAVDLQRGRIEAGAARFVDDLALGPGAWSMLPPDIRVAMVANAATFLAVIDDPQWDQVTATPDLSVPVLLTDGTDSPAWMPAVVQRLAASHYRHAARHTFVGGGHVPHLTNPGELVEIVRSFVRSTMAGAGTGTGP
jgi:pimeloyl-ACP methyl ester carboxylesterase